MAISSNYDSDFRNLPTGQRGGTYRFTLIELATNERVVFDGLDGEHAEALYRLVCDSRSFRMLWNSEEEYDVL